MRLLEDVAALVCDRELPIELQQPEVPVRDITDQRQHHAAANFLVRVEVRFGSFRFAPDPPPKVQFPGCVQSCEARSEDRAVDAFTVWGDGLFTPQTCLVVDLRGGLGVDYPHLGPRLLDAT